jgi:hypothetical protein
MPRGSPRCGQLAKALQVSRRRHATVVRLLGDRG